MKAIVYTSNTGFTARYAQMLGQKLELPVLELKTAMKQLPKGTEVIYMGWLFASAVKGYSKANDRFKVCALIGVGLCETGTLIEDVMKTNEVAEGVPVFTLQGGMDHSKLKGINKFMINMLIACASYFVYGMRLEPVLCGIIYAFVTSTVCSKLRATEKETVKFEIITQDPQGLCKEITGKLHQSATILDAHGAYSGRDTKLVLCITGKKAAPHVEALLLSKPDCIVCKSTGNSSLTGVHYI